MCNCCNGVGHEFESRGMVCKIIIRDNIMSVCLPWNSIDLEVKACPLCGRNLATTDNVEDEKNTPIVKQEKQFNPDLWKPVGFKPVEITDYSEPGKSTGGFLPYQAPDKRYEVRGIMPKAPEYPKRDKESGTGYE